VDATGEVRTGFFAETFGQPAYEMFHPTKASKTAPLTVVKLVEMNALSPPARVWKSLVSMVCLRGRCRFYKRAAHSPLMKNFASPF
jgi:hypothetical protein